MEETVMRTFNTEKEKIEAQKIFRYKLIIGQNAKIPEEERIKSYREAIR